MEADLKGGGGGEHHCFKIFIFRKGLILGMVVVFRFGFGFGFSCV